MDGDFRLAIWNGGKALLNQRVCKITPNESVFNSGYMYYMLPKELKRIEDTTSFATVKHLSVKKIKDIKIPLPPLDQQKKIASYFRCSRCSTGKKQKHSLKSMMS